MAKQLEWLNVDPNNIKDPEVKKAWLANVKGLETFEKVFTAAARREKALDDNQDLKFSYKYNKIGIAKVAKGNGAGGGGTFNI